MKYLLQLSILIISLSIYSCNPTNDQKETALPDDYSARIDSLLELKSPRFFNGVVLITQDGETKYLKEYGVSDFEKETPISIDDKFRIMSNSKQITAVLTLREVAKGKIDLQSTVSEYLPDLSQSWKDEVTVHQLLNMSSGISGLEEPLLFEAGKGYRYSNPGYGLLGRIIEKVSGTPYIEAANQLFQELGMENTYCYEVTTSDEGLSNGYWLIDGELDLVVFDSMGFGIERWKDFAPAGGIISNARDLTIWDRKLYQGEILDSTHHQIMVTPSNMGPHAAFGNDTIGYAYGLRVHDQHPIPHLGHGGRGFGFVSIKFYIPEKDVDVIVWENLYSRDPGFMSGEIVYYFENEIRKIVLNSNLVK